MENQVGFLYQLSAKLWFANTVGRCNIELLSLQMSHVNNISEERFDLNGFD